MTIRNGEEGGHAVRRVVSPSPRADAQPQVGGAGAPHEGGPRGEHSTIVVRIGGMTEHVRWVDGRVDALKRGRGRHR